MEFIQANWEWFLLGFMIVEKAIKLSTASIIYISTINSLHENMVNIWSCFMKKVEIA